MIHNRIIYTAFSDWRFRVTKAKGSFLWDESGKRYIDFTSGWNVTNLGWNHPEVNAALVKQAKKNVYNPMWTSDPVQEKYAAALLQALPHDFNTVVRATGGMEANEEAMKIARAATGKKKIIGFANTYHGQSFASLALAFTHQWSKDIDPLVPQIVQLEYPDVYRTQLPEAEVLEVFLKKLEKILKPEDVAAIVVESGIVTGHGNVMTAPQGFLKAIRSLTKKYGAFIILDEVGTGFSRCGKLFGMQLENVKPDIVTLAKGITNGAAAMGAAITFSNIAKDLSGTTGLSSTFGWTPAACAAALTTLKVHQRDKIWLRAKRLGDYTIKRLKDELLDHPHVGDVRGKGLEIGLEFVTNKKTKTFNTELVEQVVKKSFQAGLHLVSDHTSTIQIMPPLTIEEETLQQGLNMLVDTIKKTKN